MLADHEKRTDVGTFDPDLHLPATFIRRVIEFIAGELPRWRDDPRRKRETRENALTAQLCGFLNSATRKAGIDFVSFQSEFPDPVHLKRALDLAPVPRGSSIWINGREHTYYDPLMPIECKRLPTPDLRRRERREYLHTRKKTTGGVQRFMAGHHGSGHNVGVMIGYVQNRDAPGWLRTLNYWVAALAQHSIGAWTMADTITTLDYHSASGHAVAISNHARPAGNPIKLWHLLVEM